MLQTVKTIGIQGKERWDLRWTLNKVCVRSRQKEGGRMKRMVKRMVSAEPEMCLLSMATKKTSLTREDGLLGSSSR